MKIFMILLTILFILTFGCFDFDETDSLSKVDFDYVCYYEDAFAVVDGDGFVSLEKKTFVNLTKNLYLEGDNALDQILGLDCVNNLDFASTNIKDISSVKQFSNLKKLSLFLTDVEDISPISELENLEELNLGFTNVSDISSLSNLNNLKIIKADYTKISDFSPIYNLTQLEELYAWGSEITRRDCLELKSTLSNTKVVC